MTLDVESRIAVVESRLDELSRVVSTVVPLVASVARVEEKVNTLSASVAVLSKEFHDDRDTASVERRSVRNALFIMAGSLGAAVITGAAVVIAGAPH